MDKIIVSILGAAIFCGVSALVSTSLRRASPRRGRRVPPCLISRLSITRCNKGAVARPGGPSAHHRQRPPSAAERRRGPRRPPRFRMVPKAEPPTHRH